MENSEKQGQCFANGSEKYTVDSQFQNLEEDLVHYEDPSEDADINLGDDHHMIDDHVDNSVVDVGANSSETLAVSPHPAGTLHPLAKPLSIIPFEDPCGKKNNLKDAEMIDVDDSESEVPRIAFMIELENFHKEMSLEFKPPKFYGEPLNLLKLWRAVSRLGGYDTVTSCKLWRQVGESFHPPKTCTTVSWTFRIFYEKALLEYEKHKRQTGELEPLTLLLPEPAGVENNSRFILPIYSKVNLILALGNDAYLASKELTNYILSAPNNDIDPNTIGYNQVSGSGRMRRDAAARAMQGWHAQRLLGDGEVGEPIIKDKNFNITPRREKNLKSIGLPKHKKSANVEHGMKDLDGVKQLATSVVDVGPPANWVKINVRETKDCFEVYALVPGLLREEVRVQSDPAGRLVITGQPEQAENPWGITPFKKVVSLPGRIDSLQTSAVVSLHGRLFVRVPLENPNTL